MNYALLRVCLLLILYNQAIFILEIAFWNAVMLKILILMHGYIDLQMFQSGAIYSLSYTLMYSVICIEFYASCLELYVMQMEADCNFMEVRGGL